MSHAKRVTRDNRKNPENHVVAAIRKLQTDTNCPAQKSWPNHDRNEQHIGSDKTYGPKKYWCEGPQMKMLPVYVGSFVNRQHFRLRFFAPNYVYCPWFFQPLWSEMEYRFWPFCSQIGYGFCTLVLSSLGIFFRRRYTNRPFTMPHRSDPGN